MSCRKLLTLLSLSAPGAASGDADHLFDLNDVMVNVHSNLPPSQYLGPFMSEPRFNAVLADIQRFALLPSRAAAIDYFCKNNRELIDLDAFKRNLAHRNGYFTTQKTAEVEALKDRLLRITEDFLACGETLRGGQTGPTGARSFYARRLDGDLFNRCFKAIGLLASSDLWLLDLSGTGVVELTPLAPLVSLIHLYLSRTNVHDLTPLAPLVSLERLDLDHTQVVDLTPLAPLVNLEALELSRTRVVVLTPLAHLGNLAWLSLLGTQVVDLTPLAHLFKLHELFLSGHVDRTPLSHLLYHVNRDRSRRGLMIY